MPMTTELAAVPTLQDRAGQLAALGWKERDAEWLALVALHSGVFLRSQWCRYFEHANREAARVLVHQLIDKQLAIEDARVRVPGGARAVLLTGKPIYRALGIEDVRHRRGKQASLRHCQLVEGSALLPREIDASDRSQPAHVTASHSTNARVWSRRW